MKTSMHSCLTLIVVFLNVGALGFLTTASVVSVENISYPVAELENCASEGECKSFCDKPENSDVCTGFAEKYNLTSGDNEKAKKFKELNEKPGNCKTTGECESYCNDISHIDECVAFAEKNNFMTSQELEEAKKLQAALAKGSTLPGSCNSKDACDSYCNDPNNMEECIIFGESAGLIPADELDEARKVLQAVKKGAKPPPCRGKAECDSYCNEPNNFESCITFAEAAGLIPANELEDVKKTLQAIKKGAKPPNCRGKVECDAYCIEPSHIEECIAFAAAAGYMSEEEAVMVRKTGGVGPGGCRSKEVCDSFCNNPDNEEFCIKFGLEHGVLSQDRLRQIEKDKIQMQESLNGAAPEVITCLVNSMGQDRFDKVKSGDAILLRSDWDKMRACFDSYESQWQEREQRMREEQEQRSDQQGEGMYEGGQPSETQPSSGENMEGGYGQIEGQPTNGPTTIESSGHDGETTQPNQEQTATSPQDTSSQQATEPSPAPAPTPTP